MGHCGGHVERAEHNISPRGAVENEDHSDFPKLREMLLRCVQVSSAIAIPPAPPPHSPHITHHPSSSPITHHPPSAALSNACSTHTEDLRRITHVTFYEAYRKQTLLKLGFNDNPADQPPVRCAAPCMQIQPHFACKFTPGSWRESLAQKHQQRLAEFSARESEIRNQMVLKVWCRGAGQCAHHVRRSRPRRPS